MIYSLVFINIGCVYQKRQCGNSAGVYSFLVLVINENKINNNYNGKTS